MLQLRWLQSAIAVAAMTASPLLLAKDTGQDNATNEVKNIVLVHGAWADGSSWSKVIPLLVQRGFNVVAVQNPLTSLVDDVTATRQAIDRIEQATPGPVLLVGHSYGGTIITEAGSGPDVAGLVYIAAFAPDQGEVTLLLAQQYPTPAANEFLPDNYGFLLLSHEGIFDDFAQDLPQHEKEVLFATQGPTAAVAALEAPITSVAWKIKPTWFVVAANDRTISPKLEKMEAARMKATTIVVPTSHVAMIAEPSIVADFIMLAARSAGHK